MGEPIYDEEYVGADICEVFEEEGNIDPIYDDEYVSNDIHEFFGKDECKSLKLLVTKEPLKDTTNLCMIRPIPKPPWEVVSMDFPLGLLWSLCYLQCCRSFTILWR